MSDPVVTLGGRDFPVPELAIAQLRKVFPALGHLAHLSSSSASLLTISEDDFALLVDTIWIGVAGGSPGFTRKDFDALPAKPAELLRALTVIAQQSGMLAKPGEGKPNGAGEAQATAPSIGMGSSPVSSAPPAGPGTTSSSE
jgi:hypothetical protein